MARSVRQSAWLSRTERQVLLACLSFLAILAVGGLFRSELSDSLRPVRPRTAVDVASARNDGGAYTGSILFVPRRGDGCWQRFLDNRTGRLWDNGFVSCETTAPDSVISQTGGYSTAGRMDAIRKGFVGSGR